MDGALMATTETSNTDLARAEIIWKAADALRGLTPDSQKLLAGAKTSEPLGWR
jgi:hypothetical protein